MKIKPLAKIYGDSQGPFGFPMRDDVAKTVDALWKDLPQECRDMGYMRVFKAPLSMEFVDANIPVVEDDVRIELAMMMMESLDVIAR